MDKLLVICGPTATGKTKLAIDLAKGLNGEIISADSRQIYKNFDALTGKDRPTEGEKIWMYDVVDIGSDFSVGEYERMAQDIIDDIRKRGKLPIAVGGTGLYLKALTQPLSLIHIPQNKELRESFENQPKEILQRELQKKDRKKWDQMNNSDRNNPRRLIRALEIVASGTQPSSSKLPINALWIGLTAPLDILEKRIFLRIRDRWEQVKEEVKQLYARGIISLPLLGLHEVSNFLAGSLSEDEAKRRWALHELQYAKRQLTWFKKQKHIHWFDITPPGYYEETSALITSWYTGNI